MFCSEFNSIPAIPGALFDVAITISGTDEVTKVPLACPGQAPIHPAVHYVPTVGEIP